MSNLRPIGTGADRPSVIYAGTEIQRPMDGRNSPSSPGHPPGTAHMPGRAYDALPKQKSLLMGGEHRRTFVEVPGRLELIIGKLEAERRLKNLDLIENQRRFRPRGAR